MSADHEADELARDARLEWRLVPQTVFALGVIAAIVIVRELFLR